MVDRLYLESVCKRWSCCLS